jgi:hypothetical protein
MIFAVWVLCCVLVAETIVFPFLGFSSLPQTVIMLALFYWAYESLRPRHLAIAAIFLSLIYALQLTLLIDSLDRYLVLGGSLFSRLHEHSDVYAFRGLAILLALSPVVLHRWIKTKNEGDG